MYSDVQSRGQELKFLVLTIHEYCARLGENSTDVETHSVLLFCQRGCNGPGGTRSHTPGLKVCLSVVDLLQPEIIRYFSRLIHSRTFTIRDLAAFTFVFAQVRFLRFGFPYPIDNSPLHRCVRDDWDRPLPSSKIPKCGVSVPHAGE